MTYATTADVLSVTGVSATSAQLAQAEAVVTIYANRTPTASASFGQRDLYWLQQATCWQAAWQSQKYGYTQRDNATSLMQDGLQVERDTEHSVTLAPLAARALKNLSWKTNRTIRGSNIHVPLGAGLRDFTLESSDAFSDWQPLEGVG
jgi:hypothetical protein